jgi:hypothetical protein
MSVIFMLRVDARTCFRSIITASKRYVIDNAHSGVITTRENAFALHRAAGAAGDDWLFVSLFS